MELIRFGGHLDTVQTNKNFPWAGREALDRLAANSPTADLPSNDVPHSMGAAQWLDLTGDLTKGIAHLLSVLGVDGGVSFGGDTLAQLFRQRASGVRHGGNDENRNAVLLGGVALGLAELRALGPTGAACPTRNTTVVLAVGQQHNDPAGRGQTTAPRTGLSK